MSTLNAWVWVWLGVLGAAATWAIVHEVRRRL